MIIGWIERLLTDDFGRERSRIEDWLSNSQSLEEIEQKQKKLSRGEAPWQSKFNQN